MEYRAQTQKIGSLFLLFSFVLAMVASAQAAGAAAFAGVGLKIANEKVPPGGMLQLKMSLTEPKPILKGNQRLSVSSGALGGAAGIALFSPKGDVSGVAVAGTGGMQVFFNSPLTSFGTVVDYPALTIAMPVSSTATPGTKIALGFDVNASNWLDPASQPYPMEFAPGVLTIGGTLSISNIVPGSGVVPAGTAITITGIGFKPTSKVKVNNAIVAATQFISSTQLRITLTQAMDMEGQRVRVINSSPNETAAYYSYQRTKPIGASTHALVKSSYPLFSRATWLQAYFKPVFKGTAFSGLALQNQSGLSTVVRLELYSSTGKLIATQLVSMGASTRIIRDYKEYFPGANPATGTEVRAVSSIPVQMLGIVGDDATQIVLPVDPSPVP